MILNSVRGLYFYYSKGQTRSIPYFSTISLLVLMLFIHLLQIGVVLKRFYGIEVEIAPMPGETPRAFKYLLLALYFTPVYICLTFAFPIEKLKQPSLEQAQLKRYRNYFFIYAFLNLCILILLVADKITFGKG